MSYNNYGSKQHHDSYSSYYDDGGRAPPPKPPPHRSPTYDDYQDHRDYDRYENNSYPMGGVGGNKRGNTASSNYDRNPYDTHYEDYRTPTPSNAPSDYYANNSVANFGPADDSGYVKGASSLAQNNPSWPHRESANSISEQKLVGYDDDDEDDIPRKPKKRTCFDYLCCVCCSCCPMWVRWLCCGCLLILIALAVAIGVLVATFKTPTVKFNGVSGNSGLPQFTSNGSSWTMNFQLNIQVINPNIEGITFSQVKAVAYYPTTAGKNPRPSIGGGQLTQVRIGAQSTTNITFPFEIDYDPSQDSNQEILADIVTKCGFLGSQKVPLTVDYDLMLSLKILFITITPTIAEHASFDCPIQNGQVSLPSNVALPSGVSNLLSSAPAATPTA